MINIISVDDNAVLKKGIKNILSLNKDYNLAGEASNLEELILLLNSKPCDIVLLDNEIKGMSGIDTLIDIKNQFPDVKILILSIYDEEEIINRAFNTGASGYLNKENISDELLEAIQIVNSGHKYPELSLIA